jgi:sulfur-oxidizing protein SoxX
MFYGVLIACLLSTPIYAAVPLTDVRGDANQGREIFLDRESGHCLLCHQVAQLEAPFQGNIGPDLTNVGNRLSAQMIRAKIIDPQRSNPNSVMPAYYRTTGLTQVSKAYLNQPILNAEQIEHVVAFVAQLKVASPDED